LGAGGRRFESCHPDKSLFIYLKRLFYFKAILYT